MKKLLLVSLVSLLVLISVLAGCSGKTSSPPPTPAPQPAPTSSPAPAPMTSAPAPVSPPPPSSPAPQAPKPINLIFATFLPQNDKLVSDALMGFGKELETRSGGKVKVEYSWAGALGKPGDYYDLVNKGVCDVALTFTATTPGVFPMSDINALPWIGNADLGTKATEAIWKAGYLNQEFSQTKVLFIHGGPPGILYSNKPANAIADMKGLKVRSPNPPTSKQLELLGAVPVSIPQAELYLAASKGTVDAGVTGYTAIEIFKLYEVFKYAILPMPGAATTVCAMNTAKYNSLPADVKAIVDELATNWTYLYKATQNDLSEYDRMLKLFADKGGTVLNRTQADLGKMDALYKPIWDSFIADNQKAGRPVVEAIELYYTTLKKNGAERPTIGYQPAAK